jgi:hypothetical protein
MEERSIVYELFEAEMRSRLAGEEPDEYAD